MPVSILAIAAHRDDVELICGGTLLKAARQGHGTAIIDLTLGETGTRGTAELRGAEAQRAAEVLGVSERLNLELPDAGIVNTPDTRARLAREIRRLGPRIVMAPAPEGRHPDHRVAAQLIHDACFVAGLAKIEPQVPKHRPHKLLYALTYREYAPKPTFVVDITDVFEEKMEAIRCYASQFENVTQAGEVYPNSEPLLEIVRHQAAHYGSLIRTKYGEPFLTMETMRVDDVTQLEVSTF
jgi:bacillithiol biosynthesis deacetylase BshB1